MNEPGFKVQSYRVLRFSRAGLLILHTAAGSDILVVLCSPCSKVFNENFAGGMHIPSRAPGGQATNETPNVSILVHYVSLSNDMGQMEGYSNRFRQSGTRN